MADGVLIVVAFVLAAFFPLNYSRSKWSKYAPGKALMLFSIIVALVLGTSAWRVLFGPAPELLRHSVFLLVIIGLVVMNTTLLREQRADRKKSERIPT